jgi:uncharacterized protein (DUF2252 family)
MEILVTYIRRDVVDIDPYAIIDQAKKELKSTVKFKVSIDALEDYISENIYDLIKTVYSIDVSDEDTELDDDDIDSLIDTINNVMEETK